MPYICMGMCNILPRHMCIIVWLYLFLLLTHPKRKVYDMFHLSAALAMWHSAEAVLDHFLGKLQA